MKSKNKSSIILALDLPTAKQALILVEQVKGVVGTVKVGSVLFTRAGPSFVRRLIAMGIDVFLDLKFHDIPNTVALAVANAARLGVRMMTIHLSGGQTMIAAAEDAAQKIGFELKKPAPLILGVGVLTSLDDLNLLEIGVPNTVAEQVERLVGLARNANLRGLVCSAQEVRMVRALVPADVQLVVAGIRLPEREQQDQKRVGTPKQAIADGANWLVVGRPIYEAIDPRAAAQEILASLE